MSPEQLRLRQANAIERARLLELLWQNIVALRQLVDESQQLIQAVQLNRSIGTPDVIPPLAERDTSA